MLIAVAVGRAWGILLWWAIGCSGRDTSLPSSAPSPERVGETRTFCAVALSAPERFDIVRAADDVSGVDCIPPDGADTFSLGFSHAGWWLQLDIARPTLVVGEPHPFDGQAALLALDCWEWDGAVLVEEDDRAGWAARLDVTCRDDAARRIAGRFRGER